MTLNKFLEELTDIKNKIEWFVDTYGSIRGHCCNKRCAVLCPITALCYIKTNTIESTSNATQAGVTILNLNIADIISIIRAADNNYPQLQEKLVKLLGLEESFKRYKEYHNLINNWYN